MLKKLKISPRHFKSVFYNLTSVHNRHPIATSYQQPIGPSIFHPEKPFSRSQFKPRFSAVFLIEMVLPFPARYAAELDGILRAVVVARLAMGAMSVPARTAILNRDILQWAHLRTPAARHTGVRRPVLLVRHPLVKANPHHKCLQPRRTTSVQIRHPLSRRYPSRHLPHPSLGLFQLPLHHIGLIHIHKRHIHIRVRHRHTEGGIQLHTRRLQRFAKHLVGQPGIVAIRDEHIHIRRHALQPQPADEIQHQLRRPPRIDGEHKPHTLVRPDGIVRFALTRRLRDINQLVTRRLRHLLRHMPAIAATRIKEYHNPLIKTIIPQRTASAFALQIYTNFTTYTQTPTKNSIQHKLSRIYRQTIIE